MKKLMFILFTVLLTNFCFAQDVQLPLNSANKVAYSGTISKDSLTKNELFVKARIWIAQVVGTDGTITMDDKETGNVVAKGSKQIDVPNLGPRQMNFNITLAVKQGSLKYTISDISFQKYTKGGLGNVMVYGYYGLGVAGTNDPNSCEDLYTEYQENNKKKKNNMRAKQVASYIQQADKNSNELIEGLRAAINN